MPTKIENVFDEPKVCDMVAAIGERQVNLQIQFELTLLAGLMSVGGNLNPAQVPFISNQLISMYPNETIADFKICFQRGAIGMYGNIQRLDGITIGGWMKSYLDEKYEVLENMLMKEKENIYKPIEPEPGYDEKKHSEWLAKLAEACKPIQKVPGLTEDQIKQEGKPESRIKKRSLTAGYAYFDVRGIKIYASSQEHAEEIAVLAIKNGDLIE